MRGSKIDVSLILPCYNEGLTFEENVRKIVDVLKKTRRSWEIIFVEDKSTDGTRKTVEKLIGGQVRAIFHQRNLGRGKTVVDGFRAAKGAICGYMDVDGEVSANYIPLFTAEIERGYDAALGKRFYEGGLKSLIRMMASKGYVFVVKSILKIPIEDTECGFKFFRRSKVLPLLAKTKSRGWFWDTEICAYSYWNGLRISQVPVFFKRRSDKKSTVRLLPDTFDYIKQIIRFSKKVPKDFRPQHGQTT